MKRLAAALAASLACVAGGAELPRVGFLGVQLGPAANGVPGALVLGLVPGGSAADIGLAKDDIVTAVNGTTAATPAEFVAAVGRLHSGDPIAVRYVREGVDREGTATLKPRPYEVAPDVDTRYEAVEVDGVLRRAIVTSPRGGGRHPAVLYLTGIGCFSQDDASLESTESKLLYGLTRAGFVTMRIEKSGIGDSQGARCTAPAYDLETELAGYAAGLAALKHHELVDGDRVFVLGLSIGGVEAPMVAQRSAVKGVVVVNTVARPFLEYLLETQRRQGRLRNVPFDELDRFMRLVERCNHEGLVEKRPAQIVREIPECADHLNYPAPLAYMQQWAAIDPAAQWKKVPAPVLIVYGGQDFVATGDTDAPYLRAMIEAFHPGGSTLVEIPTMDHYLGHVASMEESLAKTSGILGPFEPALLETVRGWLSRQAG